MDIQSFLINRDGGEACVHIRTHPLQKIVRTPVHFCVVVDKSGSMHSGHKLDNVKRSLHHIIDLLCSQDYISIVTFNNSTDKIYEFQKMSTITKDIMRQRIHAIQAGGGTTLSDGILAAKSCLRNTPGYKQGILLLTDGEATHGITSTPEIRELATSIQEAFPGTTFNCIGYGSEHNTELLRGMAEDGGGAYNIVQTLDDVAFAFGDILGGMESCLYQQVRVILPENATQITQYPTDSIGAVIIGDLQADSETTVLFDTHGNKNCIIGVNGLSISRAEYFREVVDINEDDIIDSSLLTIGNIALLRVETVKLIDTVRTTILGGGDTDGLCVEINNLRAKIRDFSSHNQACGVGDANPVLQLLLEELDTCESNIALIHSRPEFIHETTQIMSQHSVYIGRMRGVRAMGSPIGGAPRTSHLRSVFSNPVQQSMSAELCMQASELPIPPPARMFGRQTASSFNDLPETDPINDNMIYTQDY